MQMRCVTSFKSSHFGLPWIFIEIDIFPIALFVTNANDFPRHHLSVIEATDMIVSSDAVTRDVHVFVATQNAVSMGK